MFILSDRERFSWPVEVPEPQADGSMVYREFVATFERLPDDELDPLQKESYRALLEEVLVGWDHVIDSDKNPIEYNAENKVRMLRHVPAVYAMAQAYWAAMIGREYVRKNSVRSDAGTLPVTGQTAPAADATPPSIRLADGA